MKIKTKIRLSLLFLLALILLLAVTGSFYINRLADISSAILKDNYESIQYTKNMIQALDEGDSDLAIAKFEKNLVAEENNITEVGEKDIAIETRQLFEKYKKGHRDVQTESILRQKILEVQDLNMQAILRKNQSSTNTTKRIFAYITILGTLCFLISFTFVINFPGMIADPIQELTRGIRDISGRNYSSRLNFTSHDEFGEVAEAFNAMAVRLDAYENSNLKKLMTEKKRIEAIISNFKDAVIGLDEHGHVLFANPIALGVLGMHESDIIGKYAADVAVYNDLLRTLLQTDEQEKFIKIFADDKESYFVKEKLEIDNDGVHIGSVIILRNITRFQELDAAKTNFIATISHELKTPISSLKLSLKLLADSRIGALNEEQRKLVDTMNEDSLRLLKITGELLDMTQVESGNINLNIRKVKPEEIVEQAIRPAQNLADSKGISLETDIVPDIPEVNADLEKSSWVLLNFLTNAIRFAPEHSRIHISVVPKNSAVEFSVSDSGPGIQEIYLGKVFERYFQIPGTAGKGTGMGLAISKDIIEKQNGTIGAVSEYGNGSRFWFLLS
ncbi:MAG: HAMP domain-containing protein [Bacteroidetes bacterium]|nr:HAMP domain-containing protein [Bacteroidota bacterium]